MIEEYRLPNDNIFLWLGTTDEEVNNVLILAGGDILFLKAIKTLSFWDLEVRDDMKTLDRRSFNEKYETAISEELWKHLKRKIESGEYPPFLKKH